MELETTYLAAYVLAFARIFGFFLFLPLLGSEMIPRLVLFVFCAVITPFSFAPMSLHLHLEAYEFVALLLKETALGIFLGFLVGLPLRIPELIGEIIDNQRGAAVTEQFNPLTAAEASILGQLLALALVAYFLVEGGLQQLLQIIYQSFVVQPVHTFNFAFGPSPWEVASPIFQSYLILFAILSLPVMLAMFIAEIALGISSRFAQSLNVFALSQPIKSMVAIFFLIALYPRILAEIFNWFNRVGRDLQLL